jgi:phosphatidylinositol dimannoside acyltransferase
MSDETPPKTEPAIQKETRQETLKQTLTFQAYRVAAWAGRTLPEHTGRIVFRWFGLLAHAVLPGVRATVAANQAQVLGRPPDDPLVRASTRDAFISYSRYWYDSFHARELTDRDIALRYRAEGKEHFDRALEAGRGLIVALPHFGNWDVAARWLQTQDLHLTVVVERLKPERLFRLFRENREALGMDVVSLDAGGSVGRRLSEALGRNNLVALVADRDLTGKGMPVEMFGRTRKLPTGPALLSVTSGAPVVIVGIFDEGDGWHQVIGPTLVAEPTGDRRADVAALTLRIAAEFERLISAAPSNWHLFQPGWPEAGQPAERP